jgi:hypothetical protein
LNEGLFVAVGPLDRHEQATVRALEALVARALGEELAVERLLAVRAGDLLCLRRLHHTAKLAEETLRSGIDARPGPLHSESSISAAMRLDPNTHAYVMATAFLTSICFAIAAMSVIGLAIHLFVPGAG